MTKILSSMTLPISNVKFNYELAHVMYDRMTVDFKRIKKICDFPGETIGAVLLK